MRTPTKVKIIGSAFATLYYGRGDGLGLMGVAFYNFSTVRQKRARSGEPRLYAFRQLARYSADAGAAPRSPQNPSFFNLQLYTGRPPLRGGAT